MPRKLSDNKDADITLALRSFREGDRVKTFITSINLEKKRISFGLKPSYFGEDESSDSEAGGSGPPSEPEALGVVAAEDGDAEMSGAQDEAEESESSNDEEEEDEPMEVDTEPRFAPVEAVASTSKSSALTLDVKGGFKWTEEPDEDEISAGSSSESSGDDKSGRKRKRRRKQVELDLTADMQTRAPESNADFERLLLGSPNSSYLWIQYMSFQIQLSETEKAREVAQRALKTINFREERERLNVWIALLNLENIYGTEQTIEDTFKDAVRRNDPKTVYLGLATIFEQSEKFDVRALLLIGGRYFAHLLNRKPRNSTRRRSRNSAAAPKFGPCSASSILAEVNWNNQGPSYRDVFKAWKNTNVSSGSFQFEAIKTLPPETRSQQRNRSENDFEIRPARVQAR